MDLAPNMKWGALQIARALHEYARERGWVFAPYPGSIPDDGYHISMLANDQIGRFYVTFVAGGFRGRDQFERYEDVENFLASRLEGEPELVDAISLVVEDPEEHERWEGSSLLNCDDIEIDEAIVLEAAKP